MKIALATDHAGFEQLKQLKEYLTAEGHGCVDFGPPEFDAADDYPDFIFPAARAVASGDCEAGIILGGSGQGEAMAANRIKGVRCTLFYAPAVAKTVVDAEGHQSSDPYEILRLSRQHNHANVLSLSGRFLSLEEMQQAVKTWLDTPYSNEERHIRRVNKLDAEMAVICPTVTAFDPHDYRAQIEMLEPFAKRLHIDLMDGKFAPTKSPDLEHIWLPEGIVNDVHIMYERPAPYLEKLIELKPSLVIIHYEAELDHADFAAKLQAAGIRAGLGVLQNTSIEEAKSVLDSFDHIMIFSGNLGHHGSKADLNLLDKVQETREAYPDIEIAWDGGINDQNAKELVDAGVNALNVGGFIHKAQDPQAAYAKLEAVIGTV